MLDFAVLPPEINSARMYAGPGPTALLGAADGWQRLAAELAAAAGGYRAIVTGLTSGGWAGPSAATMAAAAAPYATWLTGTAAGAEQTAAGLAAAVGAYEAAHAATVPPPLIAANRVQLATLVATNLLGQNSAAIAATEAEYLQMWAQDAAAMYGYAAASASATRLEPFTPAPQVADPTRLADAPAAAVQAVADTTGVDAQTLLSAGPQLITGTPAALQSLAAPAAEATGGGAGSPLGSLSSLSSLTMPLRMAMMPMSMLMRMLMTGTTGAAKGASTGAAAAGTAVNSTAPAAASATLARFTGAAPAPTAHLARAVSVGPLSVPPGWAGLAAPTANPVGTPFAAPAGPAGSGGPVPAGMPPMMPVANLGGRGGFGGPATQYDFRPTVVPRTPAAG